MAKNDKHELRALRSELSRRKRWVEQIWNNRNLNGHGMMTALDFRNILLINIREQMDAVDDDLDSLDERE